MCCVCFVRVSWRRAMLDRGLGPPAPFHPALFGTPALFHPALLSEFFVSPNASE